MENQYKVQNQEGQKKTNFLKTLPIIIVVVLGAAAYGLFVKSPAKAPAAKIGTATLSWNANIEPDLAGYRIYYGKGKRTGDCPPAGYPQKLDVGKTQSPEKPSYKLENLEIGKSWYFSITSYDASGNESCFSPEMSKAL